VSKRKEVLQLSEVKHKVFISYHHDDQDEVEDFIKTFDHERKVLIGKAQHIAYTFLSAP
jgi:hypothetical protein